MREKWIALIVVAAFFGLIWLYVREFPVLGNTMFVRVLLTGAALLGLLLSGGLFLLLKHRLSPWKRHLPEILSITVGIVLCMPLALSLLNRAAGSIHHESFEFVSETPYLSAQYGILKGEKIQPTGYRLRVISNGRLYTFRYKNQAYFPLTKPGETIMLPMRQGLLGFPVLQLQ